MDMRVCMLAIQQALDLTLIHVTPMNVVSMQPAQQLRAPQGRGHSHHQGHGHAAELVLSHVHGHKPAKAVPHQHHPLRTARLSAQQFVAVCLCRCKGVWGR